MNISSQPVVLPTNHRRFPTRNYSPMVFNASPIAVSNKIKAIQARKTRLTPLPTDHDYTDIRRLNFGYSGGVTSSRTDFSVFTAERLVDRSKDIRLDRISKRNPPRPSVLSTNVNQQSLLWPGYQASNEGNKQHPIPSNPPTITSPAVRSFKNKSLPCGKIPDINRRQNRQLHNDRQSSITPNEQQKKSILRTKPPQIQIHNSADRTNNNDLRTYETEEDEENICIDEEFERYLEAAIVKCADWLIKYVFNQTVDEQND
ncbi:unnamed protein product [Rotaria sp. Silwood2]|nr:unnamed protein product [Rotaria sp. Silwood2]CAF2667812.1 unnamed protein product [Rotaria sp. Silwood2]CAF3051455.1 unnamed protein product [Rotaria sp. Silwood2]CAF3237375.1 unnamed protein product [Rotaria sp. Silwood2]CAF4368078.1 unnamed protein product [Rotaria sp. Silwood2]